MISYDPLYEYMEKNHITTYALFKAGFNSATYYNMKKGKSVSVNINSVKYWIVRFLMWWNMWKQIQSKRKRYQNQIIKGLKKKEANLNLPLSFCYEQIFLTQVYNYCSINFRISAFSFSDNFVYPVKISSGFSPASCRMRRARTIMFFCTLLNIT